MAQGKVSDGKAITVTSPTGGTVAGRMYRIGAWNGIAMATTLVGDTLALEIDPMAEYRVPVGAGVAAAVGDILYMPPAGGESGANATATAAGNIAALKVMTAKDANNFITARVLNVS